MKMGRSKPCETCDRKYASHIFVGTSEDELVPVQHSLIMARALAEKKVPFEIHIFEEMLERGLI